MQTADWIVIGLIIFFLVFAPAARAREKEAQRKEEREALSQERIMLWNELIDSYDPMFGDMNNHIKYWLTYNINNYRVKHWSDYYIILKHNQLFIDLGFDTIKINNKTFPRLK